jgi:hypothetical protein
MLALPRCLSCWGSDPLAQAERDTGGGGERVASEKPVYLLRSLLSRRVPVPARRSRMRW